mmetsp:Transcript_6304/g.26460  ORF Transcript_6304/g.26460 Transcript_6304/m.26460 type:complete len:243 (-) Transcript_6304:5-733(-)
MIAPRRSASGGSCRCRRPARTWSVMARASRSDNVLFARNSASRSSPGQYSSTVAKVSASTSKTSWSLTTRGWSSARTIEYSRAACRTYARFLSSDHAWSSSWNLTATLSGGLSRSAASHTSENPPLPRSESSTYRSCISGRALYRDASSALVRVQSRTCRNLRRSSAARSAATSPSSLRSAASCALAASSSLTTSIIVAAVVAAPFDDAPGAAAAAAPPEGVAPSVLAASRRRAARRSLRSF